MRKNLEVDVPKDADTEVQRVRGLKKSIFTRTRIATLSLVLVLALSVSSTLAFEKWTGNQTPNRGNVGATEVLIGENLNNTGSFEYTLSETGNDVKFGTDTKQVKIKLSNKVNITDSQITVSFIPLAQNSFSPTNNPGTYAYSTTDESGNATEEAFTSFNEKWTDIKTETVDGTEYAYIDTDVMRLYLNNNWANEWTYNNGVFTSINTFSKGDESQPLLMGVELRDGVDESEYETYKVEVVARAVSA